MTGARITITHNGLTASRKGYFTYRKTASGRRFRKLFAALKCLLHVSSPRRRINSQSFSGGFLYSSPLSGEAEETFSVHWRT